MAQMPEPEKSAVWKVVRAVVTWAPPGPGPAPAPWAVATAGTRMNRAVTQAANRVLVIGMDMGFSLREAENHGEHLNADYVFNNGFQR
jgi:hypothetical protein